MTYKQNRDHEMLLGKVKAADQREIHDLIQSRN